MPALNGTGPNGQGPITGQGLGPCAKQQQFGFLGRCFRGLFSRGRGRGRGMGFSRNRYNSVSLEEEGKILKNK